MSYLDRMKNLGRIAVLIRGLCAAILLLAVVASGSAQTQAASVPDTASKAGKASAPDSKPMPPRVLYAPDPAYPPEAFHAKYQGTCVLNLTVGVDGLPRDIKVARGLGMGLDESAVATARTWRYEPALKDGKPMEVQVQVKIRFRIRGAETDKIAKLLDRSDANDAKADLELAKAYSKGRDVPKDEQRGFQFLSMAADWNLPEAQYLMGEHFYKVQSGSPDYVSAYMWYALSKRGGFKKGEDMLKELASKMSADQLSEADTRVDYWPEAPPK